MRREIDRDSSRLRPFVEQRADDGSRARTQIEDPARRRIASQTQGGLDQRFCIGARIQHLPRNDKIERPEPARAKNARYGFAVRASRGVGGQADFILARERRVRRHGEIETRQAASGAQQ